MPAGKKAKGRKPNRKTTISSSESPLSACKLPNDVIFNILSRLPVRTLLRFRCVCKPWKALIRSSKFISLHLHHHHRQSSATTPSLLVQSYHKTTHDQKLSIFSLRPLSLPSPTIVKINHYFPQIFIDMDVVGTINGVVCVSLPPLGSYISIFNPAIRDHMRLLHRVAKPVLSRKGVAKPDPDLHGEVSVGFGFDPLTNCYKVVCILCFKGWQFENQVHVYNCNSKSWKRLEWKLSLKCKFIKTKCDLILNDVPYWVVATPRDDFRRCVGDVLVWFDVHNEAFHYTLMAPVSVERTLVRLVDWKGKLAMLAYPKIDDTPYVDIVQYVDVWVMEDGGGGAEWSCKKRINLAPNLEMRWAIGCTRNGQITGWDGEGNMIIYDPETDIADTCVDQDFELSLEAHNYAEGLVSLKGEMPVKLLIEDDVWDTRNRYTLFILSISAHNNIFKLFTHSVPPLT